MANILKKKVNLKEKKRKKSTEAILKAALSIFAERGFSATSMSQIAQKAGVPQALIYHYFENKENLWKSVKKDALEKSHQSANFGASMANDFMGFLKVVLENRFKFYQNNPELRRLIHWETLEGDAHNLIGIEKNFEGIWTKEIRELQLLGKIAKNVDPKLMSILIRSTFSGVFDDIPKLYQQDEIINKQKEYLEMILKSLLSLS